MNIIQRIIADNQIMPGDVPRLEEALFLEGAERRRNVEGFLVLMLLATIIATYGVMADSTATVVGAMIIAPLMTPIMGVAAALVMGRMATAGRSLLLVGTGILIAVSVSWFLSAIYWSDAISLTENAQISSRVAPGMIDLYAALASGAAGAFAMSRKDLANTIPGVAIAIALVPPLAVVGVSLSQGSWPDALGALLLFLTNFLSILLAGGGVFALLGLSAAATGDMRGGERRKAFTVIAASIVLVTLPLAASGVRAHQISAMQLSVNRAATDWLEATNYRVVDITVLGDPVLGDEVELHIAGDDPLPPVEEFTDLLSQQAGAPGTVRLRIVSVNEQTLAVEP